MSEHAHAVNAAVTGISALPGAAGPLAAARAMTRFLNHDEVPFHALIEPAQDAVREALAARPGRFAPIVHDWCMFNFGSHDSKGDRRRSHAADVGYELGSALAVDADDGRPLGPMEFRLRIAGGVLSTRPGGAEDPPGRVDELGDVMAAAESRRPPRRPVHVVDREADSVGRYREWQAAGRLFLVRADASRVLLHGGRERKLDDVVADLGAAGAFVDAADAGGPAIVTIAAGVGRVKAAEAAVVLHRPAKRTAGGKTAGGHKRKQEVPGPPPPLRMVVTRVVGDLGTVLAEWRLLANVPAEEADAATIGRWYARRWEVETYHRLLKTSGMNAEAWRQQEGEAFLRRLCIASTACLTVWHLRRDESAEAARLRKTLVRLSGRRMRRGVESTAPALLAGLERLLAIDDLMRTEDLAEVLALARRALPRLFPQRPG